MDPPMLSCCWLFIKLYVGNTHLNQHELLKKILKTRTEWLVSESVLLIRNFLSLVYMNYIYFVHGMVVSNTCTINTIKEQTKKLSKQYVNRLVSFG